MVEVAKIVLADNPVVCHYNLKIVLICITSDTETLQRSGYWKNKARKRIKPLPPSDLRPLQLSQHQHYSRKVRLRSFVTGNRTPRAANKAIVQGYTKDIKQSGYLPGFVLNTSI